MVLIFLFIGFIVPTIILFVYIDKVTNIKKKYLSEKKIKKMSEKAAKNAMRIVSIITCEYCDAEIDTEKEKVCPKCGASYGSNKDWINNNTVDEELYKQELETNIQKAKEKFKAESAYYKEKIIEILIIGGVFFITLLICLISFLSSLK